MKCYHLSWNNNRKSILENGLIPGGRDGKFLKYPPAIFVTTDINELQYDWVGYEDVDIWCFDVDKHELTPDPVLKSKHQHYITFQIPKEKLKLMLPDSGYPELKTYLKMVRKGRGFKRLERKINKLIQKELNK